MAAYGLYFEHGKHTGVRLSPRDLKLEAKTTPKPKFTKAGALMLHEEAVAAAKQAEADFREKHGEPWYCGFAWVKITPATSSFARQLRKAGVVDKVAWDGGYDIWNPGGSHTQSMDIKEHGAAAYADTLREAGIDAYAMSRAD